MAYRTEGHALLTDSGKTPAEVARGTGRSIPTVMRWFKTGKPDIESVIALRDLLGIPPEAWTKKLKRNGKAA